MKKSILFLIVIAVFFVTPVNGQVGKFLKKVSNSVASEIVGKPESSSKQKTEPEPKCACEQPDLVFDLGKYKLMYSELSMLFNAEGAMLLSERNSKNYYIVKDGVTEGPVRAEDPRLAGFNIPDNSGNPDNRPASEKEVKDLWANNPFISKSGEKYLIKFNGKSYGPYGEIREFKVSSMKDKFAAIIVESVPISEAEIKQFEEAGKNAKTDQEKMDIAMKYSQLMQKKMQQGGGPMSTMPKFVTNIEGAAFDPLRSMGGTLNTDIKYNDILIKSYDKISDLSNKVLFTLNQDAQRSQNCYVNSSNSKYAWYNYGTLTFSDGTVIAELVNPRLIKTNGQVYIAYMYYSPKRNSIMQCKIAF